MTIVQPAGEPSAIPDLVRMHARATPAALAATDGPRRLTYAELDREIQVWARALLAADVGRGDRVLVLLPPGLDYYLSILAAGAIGAQWVGLDPRHRRYEHAHILTDAAPKLVLSVKSFDGRDYADELRAADPSERVHVTLAGSARERFLSAGLSVSDDALVAARDAVLPDDCAVIVYTSGTTGAAKGAMLSHGAIVRTALANVRAYGREALSSGVCAFAPNHVGAIDNLCAVVLAAGGCIHFHPRIDLAAMAEIHERERVTYAIAAPTLLQMLLDAPEHNYLRSPHMRLLVMGGAVTPLSVLERLPVGPNLAFSSIFGQTETCGMITATEPGDPLSVHAETFGRPIDGVSLRIRAADGTLAPPLVSGELEVAGPCLMSGYLGRPDATRDAFTEDGWLRTGDECVLREDGRYRFVGRLKEMFKSGGYNVYPAEVERTLCDHPAVSMAAVLPVPHDRFQEVGHAYVLLRDGAGASALELRNFVKERLAGYKVPHSFTFPEELPLLPNTKIDKQTLKARARSDAEEALRREEGR